MSYSVQLSLRTTASRAIDHEQEARRRIEAGNQRSANMPSALASPEGDLVLRWQAMEADNPWQAVQRANAVSRLLIDGFDEFAALSIDVA